MPCEVCPVAAGRPCLGEIHPPVCNDIRAGQPGRAAQLVAVSIRGDRGDVAPDRHTDGGDLRVEADLCSSGAGPCGCGVEPRRCGHPDRPLEVWRPDCLVCVGQRDWTRGGGFV